MNYLDAIASIKGRHYMPAANYMLKQILGNGIHSFSLDKRRKLTNYCAKKLRVNHQNIYSLQRSNFTPAEIAEQAYEETRFQLDETLTPEVSDKQPS